MKKLLFQILVLSLFVFATIRAVDFMVVTAYAMQVKSVQAETNQSIQRQLDLQSAEIKELHMAQERASLDFAELKAKFSIVYGMLAAIGGVIFVQVLQRYAGERRK